jgi:hypothetical protein
VDLSELKSKVALAMKKAAALESRS